MPERAVILQCSPFLRAAAETLAAQQNNVATVPDDPDAAFMQRLRRDRRAVMLNTALDDLSGRIDLTTACHRLSDFADDAVKQALHTALQPHVRAERLPEGDAHGIFILAMGKWGARELNYSSDIDWIVFFDPERTTHPDRQRKAAILTVRTLIRLLSERTADGPGFRVDLRLRPDPASVQAAVSTDFAEGYYRNYGRTWERCAFLKARCTAGDFQAGAAFLQRMQSFVHRESVDFSIVDDVAGIKRAIRKRYGDCWPRTRDYDVKLGAGGIRDIELHVQTLQLLRGGRDLAVRVPDTFSALQVLQERGYMPAERAQVFAQSYRLLRQVEHAAQLRNDEQTHRLPSNDDDLRAVLTLANTDGQSVRAALLRAMRCDHQLFPAGPRHDRIPDGFADFAAVRRIVRGWEAGALRSVVSDSDRRRLGALLPDLLGALVRMPNPDEALRRLDRLLQKLTGLHVLHMAQPAYSRLAELLSAAPVIAERAAATASLPEMLLYDDGAHALSPRAASVRIVLRLMNGDLAIGDAGAAFAEVARHAIDAAVPADIDVVALGSFGADDMHAASDLDLLLLTADPPSDAQRRAVRTAAAALTAAEIDGPLYALDLRLRPDGSDGVPVVGYAAFAAYHAGRAQTWEKLALLRARTRTPAVADLLRQALHHRPPAAPLRAELSAMRAKMLHHRPPTDRFDVKLSPGGISDLHFYLGTLALVHDVLPDFTAPDRIRSLIAALRDTGVIAPPHAEALVQHFNTLSALVQARAAFGDLRHPALLRLCDPEAAAEACRNPPFTALT